MFWFKRLARPVQPSRLRFAALKAMSPEDRAAALAGAESARWIESAALYGFVEAQFLLGQRLLALDDLETALRWFEAAAKAGHVPAINMVGRCHEKGWGTMPDFARAAANYRDAAGQGLDWAQFNLANLLLYGLGVPQNRLKALDWYRRAAGQGHAKSMNMLGRFADEGWTGPRSPAAAAAWFRRAAEAGDYRGQFNYGVILAEAGRVREARALFARALDVGDPDFRTEACATLRSSSDPSLRALACDRPRGGFRCPGTPPRRC